MTTGPTIEKRKRIRNSSLENKSVFIEIQHSFGPLKKSVYKVNEFDEYGLSFFVPFQDGYFMVGTPISFVLICNDQGRTRHFGIVRHYTPHYKDNGEKYYKIGIEIQSKYRDVLDNKFELRPVRYSSNNGNGKSVAKCLLNENEYEFELADYSKFSAAFYSDTESLMHFRISMLLDEVNIIMGGHPLYQGAAIITKIYRDKNGNNRVVIEPRNQLINIELADWVETVSMAVQETRSIIRKNDDYQQIDGRFKSSVADLRLFMEDYRNFLESPKFKAEENVSKEFLGELFEFFYPRMDEKVIRIDDIVRSLKLQSEQDSLYKSYYQKHLLPLILSAPVTHRSYFKPSGYPGDYEIMNMVHKNDFDGDTLFAKLINKYSTEMPGARVARKRTEYLANAIADFVGASSRDEVKIFSIASGPSLEIEYLLSHYSDITNRISLTLLDQEINALKFAQDRLYEKKIKFNSEIRIKFIHQSISDYLKDAATIQLNTRYDFIYAFGLFDYFSREVGRFVIKNLLPHLNTGGELIVSNASLDNFYYRTYAEYGMDWYLFYRDRKDLIRLIDRVVKGRKYQIDEIENGMMKFLIINQ